MRPPWHIYSDLLAWRIAKESPEHCTMGPEDGVAYIAVQASRSYQRPVWQEREGAQQMMVHRVTRSASTPEDT